MKVNMPVTDVEHKLRDGEFIVSTTDLKGTVTYANQAFIELSGFSEDELLGKNHNLVRHPDMPADAFQWLWDTMKEGKPWNGFVKNRCKNGDYYWVNANVTPVRKNGQVVEYLSVRTKPSESDIRGAEELYRKINAGEVNIFSRSLFEGLNVFKRMKLTHLMLLSAILMVGSSVGFWATATFGGQYYSFESNVSLYNFAMIMLFVSMVVGVGILAWVGRSMSARLHELKENMQEIASGDYFNWSEINNDDEIGKVFQSLRSMQIKLASDVNQTETTARRALRIQTALDNVSSNVMVADNQNNIIYMNEAVRGMMVEAEPDIRKDLPEFNASNLVGQSIDNFHKNPNHQKAMLDKLRDRYSTQVEVGGRTFKLTANPVFNAEKKRMGTAVEWLDVTVQLEIEDKIKNLIDEASAGDLNARIDTQGVEGFLHTVGTGINAILGTVVTPIRECMTVLEDMARGNLTNSMSGNYLGEFGILKNSVNEAVLKLSETVSRISESTGNISTAANEISQGNTDLSRRTEQQAANLEETSSSMEELNATVKQNADNAREANQMAANARELAEKGGEVVGQAVNAMSGISQSSKQIAEIIGVIDEIAFQTNLLALNASVEAARAGEQGRGFAVVAGEVRSLAQRSATAAKEIKDLIKDSVSRVDQGSTLVDASGQTLQDIVLSVKKVSDIVAEIASASHEQALGIQQVTQAVTHMDDVTQQNAALVEEAAAAAEAMDEQAGSMQNMVNMFVLDINSKRTTTRSASSGFDFSTARSKHLLWKSRIQRFLDDGASMDRNQALDHHSCDLGKWLDKEGQRKYGHLEEMKDLYDTHKTLHNCIKDVVKHKESGDEKNALVCAEKIGGISEDVVQLINMVEAHANEDPIQNQSQSRLSRLSARPKQVPKAVAPAYQPPARNPTGNDADSEWQEF